MAAVCIDPKTVYWGESDMKDKWEQAFLQAMGNGDLDLADNGLGGKYVDILKAIQEYLNEAEKVYFRAGYLRGEMDAAKSTVKG